jgi:hypothetical protein
MMATSTLLPNVMPTLLNMATKIRELAVAGNPLGKSHMVNLAKYKFLYARLLSQYVINVGSW